MKCVVATNSADGSDGTVLSSAALHRKWCRSSHQQTPGIYASQTLEGPSFFPSFGYWILHGQLNRDLPISKRQAIAFRDVLQLAVEHVSTDQKTVTLGWTHQSLPTSSNTPNQQVRQGSPTLRSPWALGLSQFTTTKPRSDPPCTLW